MISLTRLLKEVQGNPKAIILAGAPGAGKGSILGDLDLSGLKVFNLDDTILALAKVEKFSLNQKDTDAENRSAFMKAMAAATKKLKDEQIPTAIANKDSFILDGTAASSKQTQLLVDQLKEAGYDIMMLYVYTHLETSLKRNERRFEKSGGQDRSLMPSAVYRTWIDVAKNFETYQQMFGNNFVSVSNLGKDETMKDVEQILKKYIDPFKPTDAKPKTDKEIARSKKQSEELNKEIQDFLNSNKVKNIIDNSVSKEEAQSKITSFING
jgi:adenylate kinase family enzyme